MRRGSAMYWAQFENRTYIQDPPIEFMKFSLLLAISVYALLRIDDNTVRTVATFISGCCVVILFLILVFSRKRI